MSRYVLGLIGAVLVAGGITAYLLIRGGDKGGGAPAEDDVPPYRANLAAFRDEAPELGLATFRMHFLPDEQGEKFKINLYDHGCGVAVADDFDGKGHTAIYFLNQLGPNALYRRNGDGTFTDITKAAGVALGDRVCVGAAWADTRNNGLQDLYVTSTRGRNVFFRNNGDGTFTEVTEKVGLKHVGHSQTAVFFDYDNDGFLDLLVTNTAKWTLDYYDRTAHYFPGPPSFWNLATAPHEFNILYHNNGDGTFTNVSARSGLKGKGWGGDVAVFDYNNDGFLDVFITNMFGANQLYRNNGDGTFTDVAREVLGRTSWGAIGCKVFDFNNDGRLDLFVADMHSDMWLPSTVDPRQVNYNLKKKYPNVLGPRVPGSEEMAAAERHFADVFRLRYKDVVFGNTLFKKLPSGEFKEVSDAAGMETFWPWGVATGDFDNDGHEDVFLPSGMGHPYSYWPNVLLMNNGNDSFSDKTEALGIEPPRGGRYLKEEIGGRRAARSSRCAATVYAGNGRLDLAVNNFNDRPYYFRNHFPQKNWIAFRLTGTVSNKDAIGALVSIYPGKEVMVRQVHGAGGYLSQSSRVIHFGLGERTKVDRVVVRWPGRGHKPGVIQEIKAPAVNQLHSLTEPRE